MNYLTFRIFKIVNRIDEIKRDKTIGISFGYHITKKKDIIDIKYKKN